MQILMPKVGLTMTEGSIVQWHKREGDHVARGEPLFTFETEKSTLEFESPAEGTLSQILIPAGQVVACFVPVAEVGEGGASNVKREDVPVTRHEPRVTGAAARKPISPRARMRAREMEIDVDGIAGSGPEGAVRERDVMGVKRETSNVNQQSASASVRATPVAQRIAAEMGIDLAYIRGTGRDGMITREDVERQRTEDRRPKTDEFPSPPQHPIPSSDDNQTIPLTPIRRITAERMTENAQTAPHVTLTTEADASALVSAREQLIAELSEKISYNALLIAIAVKALGEHPAVNASWNEKTIDDGRQTTSTQSSIVHRLSSVVQHTKVHIGLAVDTPRGLLVPVLRDCSGKGLAEIHRQLVDVVTRAQAGKARPDELSGGTFTITNLGMFEIDAFTPIINLPEAAILGVGRIVKKAVVLDDDRIVPRSMMTLSLSFDHRVMDGATAAKFLQRVKQLVERPMALLLRSK